jgi:hypothetical protein
MLLMLICLSYNSLRLLSFLCSYHFYTAFAVMIFSTYSPNRRISTKAKPVHNSVIFIDLWLYPILFYERKFLTLKKCFLLISFKNITKCLSQKVTIWHILSTRQSLFCFKYFEAIVKILTKQYPYCAFGKVGKMSFQWY